MKHSHPTPDLVAWFKLAADYERARLGSDISPQTEQALQQMVTFLTQPAQCYTPVADESYAASELHRYRSAVAAHQDCCLTDFWPEFRAEVR